MIDKFDGTYSAALATLRKRLSEPAPARVQFLLGPRQVGKTTLLRTLAKELGDAAIYVSADAPSGLVSGVSDRLIGDVKERATRQKVCLLLDEVQTLSDWSRWLKALYDSIHWAKLPIHIVATGSSSLKLAAGSRESMAGRFEVVVLNHWGARDLIERLHVPRAEAVRDIVSRGGYPGAVQFWKEPDRWKDYLGTSIVEPAIGRDILHFESVRKPALLRQVFAIASAHPAEIITLEKLSGSLTEKGSLDTVAHYLSLLNEAFLVAPVQKYSATEIRRRRSPSKLITLNNALLVAGASSSVPDANADPVRWGHWVENACLAYAINRRQVVNYWREEPWEADAVFSGSWGKWLIEVKTGDYSAADLKGLACASERLPEFKPLVLCDPKREHVAKAASFAVMTWQDFLMDGLA